ncbi:MAG: universal stress protein [Deltaproteobacteria bacterium]|nr:universal stress protein [Deltaproteobacteria bacterium]MBW2068733.1 universal stress protein [Deltaproteobacteria bacterium]
MRILFVADQYDYSAYALEEVAELARNTFADVTMLGVLPRDMARSLSPGRPCDIALDHPMMEALEQYRESFLSRWKEGDSPYERKEPRYEWFFLGEGVCEQLLICRGSLKDLKVRLRFGQPVSEVLSAVEEEGASLVVLGCTRGDRCLWRDDPTFPQKLVQEVPCSILLVKEAHPISEIHACMDESNITQDSLEMVNQIAVLHDAKLNLVALTKGGGIKAEVYPWFDEVYAYYRKKGLDVTSQFKEIDEFERFIREEVQHGLLALWMGKKSLLSRLFHRDSVEHFIGTCRTSVLVLR